MRQLITSITTIGETELLERRMGLPTLLADERSADIVRRERTTPRALMRCVRKLRAAFLHDAFEALGAMRRDESIGAEEYVGVLGHLNAIADGRDDVAYWWQAWDVAFAWGDASRGCSSFLLAEARLAQRSGTDARAHGDALEHRPWRCRLLAA